MSVVTFDQSSSLAAAPPAPAPAPAALVLVSATLACSWLFVLVISVFGGVMRLIYNSFFISIFWLRQSFIYKKNKITS
jgi:hypothetical protein